MQPSETGREASVEEPILPAAQWTPPSGQLLPAPRLQALATGGFGTHADGRLHGATAWQHCLEVGRRCACSIPRHEDSATDAGKSLIELAWNKD